MLCCSVWECDTVFSVQKMLIDRESDHQNPEFNSFYGPEDACVFVVKELLLPR